jgi:trimeric autotransporter adhesin
MNNILLFFILIVVANPARSQLITTIAGNGVRGYTGDGAGATNACLNQPFCITIDDSGNIYIVDVGTETIRRVGIDNTIFTFAGVHRECGYSGDDGLATIATICKPHGIVADHLGNIYISENENSIIRKISREGIISTIAGIPKKFGYNDNDKIAKDALLNHPNDITIDNLDNIYFADGYNNMIRKISKDGIITTIAGIGFSGYSGDHGIATKAQLNKPFGVAVDDSGNVFISDTHNNVIRKINNLGIITTVAGNGIRGYLGDGGSALTAQLHEPYGIALDRFGNLYISDKEDNVIRCVNADGIISTIAGNGHRGYTGDNDLAVNAELNEPYDVALDSNGNLYIADDQNHVVRRVNIPHYAKKKIAKKEISQKIVQVDNMFTVSADAENDMLTVTIDSEAYTSFTITNDKDELLIQKSIVATQTKVDISTLLPARYYINLKKDDEVKTVMFVKDK